MCKSAVTLFVAPKRDRGTCFFLAQKQSKLFTKKRMKIFLFIYIIGTLKSIDLNYCFWTFYIIFIFSEHIYYGFLHRFRLIRFFRGEFLGDTFGGSQKEARTDTLGTFAGRGLGGGAGRAGIRKGRDPFKERLMEMPRHTVGCEFGACRLMHAAKLEWKIRFILFFAFPSSPHTHKIRRTFI